MILLGFIHMISSDKTSHSCSLGYPDIPTTLLEAEI